MSELSENLQTAINDVQICETYADAILNDTPVYVELEYIQSTGTQYIDTGVKPTNHYVEVKAQYTANESNKVLFGYSATEFHITWYGNKWYYGDNGTEKNGGGSYVCTDINTFIYGTNTPFSINDNIIDSSCNASSTGNLWILRRPADDIARPANAKIFYFKIYDKTNNELVRDFIPARNLLTNEIGLYDKIENEWYYNAGTGDFIAGGVISND